MHSFETEVVSAGQEFPGIIVAKVTKVEKHPNADRLRVVELSDGKQTYAPVVCGASNFETGAIVLLALPGALIPHNQHDSEGKPFTLSKATIRGIESQGMICSAKELGLGDDGSGILVLDETKYTLGEFFSDKSGKNESLEISIPANRPDLLSYKGVAREIAALSGKMFKDAQPKLKLEKLKAKILKVRISEPKLCSRYIAVRLSSVRVGQSPSFIQNRLKESGLRPINNVVDITNYVMLELGQPLHAFDANNVVGGINVRRAYLNETIKTLDGVERKLSSENLVIADQKKALAIAGVIGGEFSGITQNTSEIILESANFNAVSIRQTSKKLGIRTDASARFEKSLPLEFANAAVAYAVELLAKYANAKPLENVQAGGNQKNINIKLESAKINELLGEKISEKEQKKILGRLGFKIKGVLVDVPYWRADVKIWQDLAEEISRLKGLDTFPNHPISSTAAAKISEFFSETRNSLEDLVAGLGFDQIYTYSFISERDLSRWGIDKNCAIEIANPLSSDQQYLRTNLTINSLKIAEQNSRFVNSSDQFEIGNAYWKEGDSIFEKTYLHLLSYSKTKIPTERILGAINELFSRLDIETEISQSDEQSASVKIGGKLIGRIFTKNNSDIKWIAANFSLESIIESAKQKKYSTISRYPAKELDVSAMAKRTLPWESVKSFIEKFNKLIKKVKLFDVYEGKNIPDDKKSLAFRIIYQADNRTLTDKEVNEIHNQLIKELETKFYLQVRN